MSDIGIKLSVDGEKAFNSALKDINSGLKLLSSELKATSSQFLDNNKSVEAVAAKNEVLNKQIDAQKEKVEFLRKTLQQATEAYGESDKRTQAWSTKLNIAEAELNKMQNQLKNGNAELEKYSTFSEKAAGSVGKLDNEISSLSTELDGIDKKYGRNKNSVEALNEKQDILNQIIEKQREKVKTLGDAVETSKDAYGATSEETKKWEAALNSAERELSDTQKELKNVDREMKTASQSTKTFGDMLKANLSAEAIKAGIQKLGEAFKAVGNYITDAVKSAASYGSEISIMSEKTGVSTQAIQKFNAAARTTGVEVETFTSTLARSIRSMNSATSATSGTGAAYAALKVNVRDTNGQLRDSETVYWETIDALKAMENETQRDAYAMQIFGKSAQELNPIIKRGSEGFRELTDSVATFDDTTIESLRSLDISFGRLGATMDGIKRSIGVAFAPMMKEIADAAAGVGSRLREIFMGIAQGEDQATINQKFERLKDSIITLATKIKEQMPLFLEVGGKIIATLWDGLQIAIKPFIPQLISVGAGLAAIVAGWSAMMATAAVAWPFALGAALIAGIAMFWPQISKFFKDIWNGISQKLGELWNNVTKFLGEHWDDLLLWIFAWPVALIKTLSDFWPQISAWLSDLWRKTSAWLGETLNNITAWFINLKNDMAIYAKNTLNAVVDWFKRLPQDIWNAISGALQKIAEWGSNLVIKGKQAANDLWNSIVNVLKNLPNELLNIGKNLVQGLWNGINGMMNWVKDKIKGFASTITGWIKNFFGISSPSTVFRDQIGKNLALGIEDGFVREMDSVAKEMQNAIPTDFDLEPIVNTGYAAAEQTPFAAMLNDPYYIATAFNQALTGVAFMVDGEKFGEMAVNSVNKVVFS